MTAWPIEHVTAFGSVDHLAMVLLVLFGRAMDLLSTWVATPSLELEANPIARWLGWRAGMLANGAVALPVGLLPLAAISLATTSVLVASRNLQSAWLVRVVGEREYRDWIAARYREGRPGVFLISLVLHAGLIGLVGLGLMAGSQWRLIPFGIGLGIFTYAMAVAVFTGLAMRRAARRLPSAPEGPAGRG